MSFLIPAARPNPSAAARLGRLAHWIALGFAALLLAMAWSAWQQPAPAPGAIRQGLPADTFLILAVLVALIGRGVRYLFAGE